MMKLTKKGLTLVGNGLAIAGSIISIGAQLFMEDRDNDTGLEDGDEVVIEEIDD